MPRFARYIEKTLSKTLLFLGATIFSFAPLFAQQAGGGYAESYLLRNVGGRAISLGGAYSSISDDPIALFYNPAGLSDLLSSPSINISQSILSNGRSHSTAVWGQTFDALEGFGFAAGFNNYASGYFLGRDVKGRPIGELASWQISLNAGASYKIDFASFGVALKYLSNSLIGSGFQGSGFGLDLGAKFDVMGLFNFGLAIQNATGMMFWNANKEVDLIPYTIRTGVSAQFDLEGSSEKERSQVTGEFETYEPNSKRYLILSLDAILTQYENAPTVVFGVEASLHRFVSFRAGAAIMGDNFGSYEFFPMTTWGAGFSLKNPLEEFDANLPFAMDIEYSITSDYISRYKIAHNLSLAFRFE